ncbi:MAG: DNA repair protein RadC [Gammaproteobacteria bacterium]|nr:DNA repair protein RadC [Gammaproteobacteria bacterium]
MQNVLPLIYPETANRFNGVNVNSLCDAEQKSLVHLALEVLELHHQRGKALTSPELMRDYLRLNLGDRKNEVFGAVYLDNKHRIIRNEELFKGSVNSASVYPRVVAQKALEYNSTAILLYHNHPSGDPEPSIADQTITKRLVDSLAMIDVRVLDHLVVGSLGSVSFAERGLI